MTVDDPDWESVAPNPKQIQLVSSPGPFFGRRGSGGSSSNASGNLSRGAVSRRASGAGMVDRIGISRMPDRAWTIALDYLELGEVSGRGRGMTFVVYAKRYPSVNVFVYAYLPLHETSNFEGTKRDRNQHTNFSVRGENRRHVVSEWRTQTA